GPGDHKKRGPDASGRDQSKEQRRRGFHFYRAYPLKLHSLMTATVFWRPWMKFGKYVKTLLFLLAAVCLLAAGCGQKEEDRRQEPKKPGDYDIYYLDSSAMRLVPQTYHTDTEDIDQ